MGVGDMLKRMASMMGPHHPYRGGDSLEIRLREEVRDTKKLLLERRQKVIDAIENDRVKRFFQQVCGHPEDLLDWLENTISTFSPRDDEDDDKLRSWLQRLGRALRVAKNLLEETFPPPLLCDASNEVSSFRWRLDEDLVDAENLLESFMFYMALQLQSSRRRFHGCWCVNVHNNTTLLHSSSTTRRSSIDLDIVLSEVQQRVKDIVAQARRIDSVKDTRSQCREKIHAADDLEKELASSSGCLVRFSAKRDQDKRNILELILRESKNRVDVVHMIGRRIVNSAISRDVIEDESVKAYFDVRIWMSVIDSCSNLD